MNILKFQIFLFIFFLLFVGSIVSIKANAAENEIVFNIGTGSEDNNYFLFGKDINTIVSQSAGDQFEVNIDIKKSDGSQDNVQRLCDGTIDTAFVQEDVLYAMLYGDSFDGIKCRTEVFLLQVIYTEKLHIATLKKNIINGEFDLNKKRVAIPKGESGTKFIAGQLKQSFDLDLLDRSKGYSSLNDAIDLLRKDKADAFMEFVGADSERYKQLPKDLELVNFEHKPLDRDTIYRKESIEWQSGDEFNTVDTYGVSAAWLVGSNVDQKKWKQICLARKFLRNYLRRLSSEKQTPVLRKNWIETKFRADQNLMVHPQVICPSIDTQ